MALKPPPPPPPPCPNVPLPLTPKKQPLITCSGWPRRLLHVKRMTSYLREGEKTYDGVEAPRYNVISYTWGRYTAQEPSLVVHGIDWPIPGVARTHFTVEAFEQAILRAARGHRSPECKWIWLDVACIPQRHEAESNDSKNLRNEEIGRQVEIFHGACEAFAWLSSLHAGSFLRHDSDRGPEAIEDVIEKFHISAGKMRNQDPSPGPSFYASEFISGLERDIEHLQHWTEIILAHPWFTSLWTLQEMALRRHAWILLDDGVLYVSGVPYHLQYFQEHIVFFKMMMEDPYTTRITEAMEKVSDSAQDSKTDIYNNFMNRMKALVQLYENRGLSLHATSANLPHSVYSAAKQRDATHLIDRILGIMQIYAIRCNPDPPGVDQKAQLQHLEDEFGEHLVAKYPLLSQLFIHTSVQEPPRRSWLITQGCSANDDYWLQFTDTVAEVGNLFETLATVRSTDKLNVNLHFRGKAWDLDSFVHASSPNSDLPDYDKNLLFNPASLQIQLYPSRYLGLILDYHVSAAALGRPIHFFPSHQAMEDAARQLYDKYDMKVYHEKGPQMVRPSSPIKVAPLGWSLISGRVAPYVRFVGLVLARSTKQSPPLIRPTTGESQPISASAFTWERLGLMRWCESYSHKNTRRHYLLPEPHEFEAVVV